MEPASISVLRNRSGSVGSGALRFDRFSTTRCEDGTVMVVHCLRQHALLLSMSLP